MLGERQEVDAVGKQIKPMLSRRAWLKMTMRLSLAGALSVVAAGCQKRKVLVCSDPARLSDADYSLRASLHYTEESRRSDQECAGCGFFQTSGNNACGTCNLLKGAVNPRGHCDSWNAAKR